MKTPITISLYDMRGRRGVSWAARIGLLAFLALCIWLSKGSTWWTLVTSCLFLFSMVSVSAQVVRPKHTKTDFAGLDDLQDWIDRQRAIEALERDFGRRQTVTLGAVENDTLRKYGASASEGDR
ncbi:MAG: hypothetical protein GX086_07690 [Alcaligenaceae bacterium]|nr:hypothetical protein [Alcaligenaceae bacterium]